MSGISSTCLNVQAIDHITLVVKDLEASSTFYADILGMEVTKRPDFGFAGLWFQVGPTQIHMNVDSEEAGPSGMPEFAGSKPSRGFHFAFEVDDCDAADQQLKQIGIDVVTGPRSRPDGARQLYIYDPDGYLVEIYSNGPC
ncbi:MAG: VOC family protein [Pirellulaceae bacterium]|nr:VOC family protein [Pirellulaceae bacterium]